MATAIDLNGLLVVVMGGGFLTGVVALLKFKPEKDAVVVSAAQGAVVVQSGVIDALQEELARARSERDEARKNCEAAEAKAAYLRRQLKSVGEEPGA